jgi:hypothetical protein
MHWSSSDNDEAGSLAALSLPPLRSFSATPLTVTHSLTHTPNTTASQLPLSTATYWQQNRVSTVDGEHTLGRAARSVRAVVLVV